MKKTLLFAIAGLMISGMAFAQGQAVQKEKAVEGSKENPQVVIETSMGNITAVLFADKAPISVANFLKYADEGFYDGTIFHRVIDGFMIQGGGFTQELERKTPHEPIQNESTNGLSNKRGTLAMARMNAPHSASSQFFVNVIDNAFLDYFDEDKPGYCVFGEVTSGLDVVDKIKAVRTGRRAPLPSDVPLEDIVLISVKLAK